jgi:hypothetical protein
VGGFPTDCPAIFKLTVDTTHSWLQAYNEVMDIALYRTNYTLSKDPDEGMGIVDDAVSFVKNSMSSLKSDSSGLFTVSSPPDHCIVSPVSISLFFVPA